MRGAYDPTLPKKLKATQEWFASIITRPISDHNQINPTAPSGRPIVKEAPDFICASPTLEPYQRMEIYCQQYWWRLLKILHENCPFVLRLFGYTGFNQTIAVPFLAKYPPDHWSLYKLGDRLPQWIREEYRAKDKSLVLDAARIDCAYMQNFYVERLPALQVPTDATELEKLLDIPMYHQPYLHLFSFNDHLFPFRDKFVLPDDGDHWIDRDFPTLKKGKNYVILYRTTVHNNQEWKEIPEAAYHYLNCFKKPCSLNQSLHWVESQSGPQSDEIVSNLRNWLQEWIVLGWLAKAPP